MRELEVLHDRLLALFEQDPTLTPKDVVVMMPDVNSYGPYIQAVFGKEGGKGRGGARGQIPFAISDRAASQESPLLQSFLALLRLPNARLGAGSCSPSWRCPPCCAASSWTTTSSTCCGAGCRRPASAGAG